MHLVSSVEKVAVAILKSMPPKVSVVAHGTVPTAGWSNGSLSPWFYIAPPADGVQDLDFVAEAPSGPVIQLPSPITADLVIPVAPADYWGPGRPLTGVRVHARTNKAVGMLDGSSALASGTPDGGDFRPWPWWEKWLASEKKPSGGDLPFPLARSPRRLLGMILRVFKSGDPITDDYIEDRVNIEIDPQSKRIVRIFYG